MTKRGDRSAAFQYSFLQTLARTMAGKRILLVTHGGTIWCCRYVLERWTYAEAEQRFATEHIPNCSVTHYELENGRLALRDAGSVYSSSDRPSAAASES